MATIVTRAGKGEPLTHAEVDANFTNLNDNKLEPVQGIFLVGARTVTADYTVASTANVMSPGPIIIADGVTVTVDDGGEWVIV